MSTAQASLEEEATHRVQVTFASSNLLCNPLIVGDNIVLRESASVDSVNVDGIALIMFPAIPPISPRFSFAGPWEICYISNLSMEALISQLNADPAVEEAKEVSTETELLGEVSASEFPERIPGGRFYDSQDGFHTVIAGEELHPEDPSNLTSPHPVDWDLDLPQAWSITRGDSNVVVAVIDTGVNYMHEELEGQMHGNYADPPGDENGDGCPGICGVDDNGDGHIDPDENGYGPDNEPELLVDDGTPEGMLENILMTRVSGDSNIVTMSHPEATYAENSLVGWQLRPSYDPNGHRITIISNSVTQLGEIVIETELDDYLEQRGGWGAPVGLLPLGFYLANGEDDDGDSYVDDWGYDISTAMINDDDENGYEDDYLGWDFSEGGDNDVTQPGDQHGTAIAGIIAASWGGKYVGVAPGARVLPIKSFPNVACGVEGGAYFSDEMVDYCALRGADIISTSFGGGSLSTSLFVTDELGLMHTNGAGNSATERMQPMAPNERAIIVGGTESGGWPWFDDLNPQNGGTDFHETVDISATSPQYVITMDCSLTVSQGGTWWGTSLSGPIVAGVLALMKSAYPHWDNEFTRAKLVASTQPIQPFDANNTHPFAGDLDGKLGSGAVNAYRALTYYGGLFPPEEQTVVWDETVWVSGDLFIPEGQHLEILPGTTIKIAQDDILSAGRHQRLVEWFVDGTISAQGTPSEPIVFEIFKDDTSGWTQQEIDDFANNQFLWGHMRLSDSANVDFEHVEFRDAHPRDVAELAPKGMLNPGDVGTIT